MQAVAMLPFPGGDRFARLTVAADGARVDIPAIGRYRVRCETDGRGGLLARFDGPGGEYEVAFDAPGRSAIGSLTLPGGETREFFLERMAPLDWERFALFIGPWEWQAAPSLLLAAKGNGAEAIPFFLQGDDLVRLYPVEGGEYLSEVGDRFVLDGEIDNRSVIRILADGTREARRPSIAYAEERLEFDIGGATIAGSLLTPPGHGPFPVAVMLHGTFPGERDFYRVFADRIVRAGVGAFVFDRRGFGESTGEQPATIAQRARDAAAVVRALKGMWRVIPGKVGLWAFSNGTWSAPMVAAEMEEVAFVVGIGATGVSPGAAEVHRKTRELEDLGVAAETVAEVRAAWEAMYAAVARGELDPAGDAEFDERLERLHHDPVLRALPLADYAKENAWLAPVPPMLRAAEVRAKYLGLLPEMGLDPAEEYARLSCPVLWVVGSEDPNTPSEAAERVGAALAGNADATVTVVEGAAHMLEVAPGEIRGMSAAEAASELHAIRFAPGALDLVADWLRKRVGR